MEDVSDTNLKYGYSERVDKAIDVIAAFGLLDDDDDDGEVLIQALLDQMDLPSHPALNRLAP